MKKILSGILVLVSFVTLAQERAKTWQVGVSGSPDYCYRIQSDPDAGFTNYPHASKLDQARAGYTLNGHVLYYLSNHFALETGVRFSQRSFGSDAYWGVASGHVKSYYSTGVRYRYLEVPLGVAFTAGNKPIHFIGTASVSVAYLLNGRNEIYHEDNSKFTEASIQNGDFRLFNMAGSVSAGAEYSYQRFHFRVAPVFWYGLFQAQSRSVTGFTVHLWSAGVNFGCCYSL